MDKDGSAPAHTQVAPGVHKIGARLEELAPGARVTGVLIGREVSVVDVRWHGSNAVTLTYRDDAGAVDQRLLYRDHEPSLSVRQPTRAYALDGDPATWWSPRFGDPEPAISVETAAPVTVDRRGPTLTATGPERRSVEHSTAVPGVGAVDINIGTGVGVASAVFADLSEDLDGPASVITVTALDGAPQRVIRTDVVDRIERSPRMLRFPRALSAALRFRKETGTSRRDLVRDRDQVGKGERGEQHH